MRITYIFGNGFDIQCGLESRYSDFLKEYIKIRENDIENIRDFKQYLSQDKSKELWSDAERAMGTHLENFSNQNIAAYTERIVDFQFKMIDYLTEQQRRCIWDDLNGIHKVFSDFLFESYNDILSIKRGSVNRDTFDREKNQYSFITFNYTNLVDNVVRIGYGLRPIYHVHGTLNTSIIMGVNDSGQLSLGPRTTLTSQLARQIIKPEMNNLINHQWDAPAMQSIQASDILVIYGVSFGQTDNIWWKQIREWLEIDKSHRIFTFVQDPRNRLNCRLVWQIKDYEDEKCGEILQKLGYSRRHPKYTQLLQQIYTVPNTTRLNLKPIILKDSSISTVDKAAINITDLYSEII